MIQDGDKIAVCISGGKDSMLMAKCFQEIKKHRKMNFELEFIVMNPGYNEKNKQKIIDNAKRLGIDIIDAHVGDATVFTKELCGIADRVLVDAPCSGLGVLRKKPDIKYFRNETRAVSKLSL